MIGLRKHTRTTTLGLFVIALLVPGNCAQEQAPDNDSGDILIEGTVSFNQHIKPMLSASCGGCHGQAGGLNTSSYAALMAGGVSGVSVVAGKPDMSNLIKRLRGENNLPRMPIGGNALTDNRIRNVIHWIEQGALDN